MRNNDGQAGPTIIRPKIGEPAPAIDLPTLGGDLWSLGDHRGRSVVVIFHRHAH